MSSLLEQAIVDATALKEAALKNAENAVLDKYSQEVKTALDTLLEQDEAPGRDAAFLDDVPLAHENPAIDGLGEDAMIEINFDDLKARLHAEEEAGEELEPSELLGSEETAEEIFGGEGAPPELAAAPEAPAPVDMGALEEDIEISDELVDALAEELTVDVAARLGGWAPVASGETTAHVSEMEAEEEAAAVQSQEVTDEQEKYRTAELYESQEKEYKNEIKDLRSLLKEAKTQLNILILENAKLLYQNKALDSASLNERQKERIVEAVRNASSVEETKMLFETLQSAVGARKSRRSESLREAVSKPTTSMLLSSNDYSRGVSSTAVDPNMERMLRLAGLKR
jgi:hypothetical protein